MLYRPISCTVHRLSSNNHVRHFQMKYYLGKIMDQYSNFKILVLNTCLVVCSQCSVSCSSFFTRNTDHDTAAPLQQPHESKDYNRAFCFIYSYFSPEECLIMSYQEKSTESRSRDSCQQKDNFIISLYETKFITGLNQAQTLICLHDQGPSF